MYSKQYKRIEINKMITIPYLKSKGRTQYIFFENACSMIPKILVDRET
jgi:hypothetical protein